MEQAGKEKKFTLSTVSGCARLLGLLIAIILVCSMVARCIATNGGTVKVKHVIFDVRGAQLDGELYYPRGTSSHDSLPAVTVASGGGTVYSNMRQFCIELARRGFAVFAVSAYGAGLSEMPYVFENGMTGETFSRDQNATGLYDALQYLYSLDFVDKTRIGMIGWSYGSRRSATAVQMNNGYHNFNDIMINVLCDTFGQSFTRDEIDRNADSLAASRLNKDQLFHYNSIKAERLEQWNTRVKVLCLVGGDGVGTTRRGEGVSGTGATAMQTVSVAGYDVERNCQVNIGYVNGLFEPLYLGFGKRPDIKKWWYSGDADILHEHWYAIDDINNSNEALGDFYSASITDSPALKRAIDEGRTRVYIMNNRATHTKNIWSRPAVGDVVRYIGQSLNYNRGDLTSSSTVPLDPKNQIWPWREPFSFIAMLAMIGMMIPLLGLLLKTRFFASCVSEAKARPEFSKKTSLIFSAAAIAITFIALQFTHRFNELPYAVQDIFSVNQSLFWPATGGADSTVIFTGALGLMTIILLTIYCIIGKKKSGLTGLSALNINIKPVIVLKCILLGSTLIAAAYGSFMLIRYLFGEEYRIWMAVFSDMKTFYWFVVLRYALWLFPMYVIIGCGINYTSRTDIPEWKDDLYTVIIYSAGVWILCIFNAILLFAANPFDGTIFSVFNSTFQLLLVVPFTVYIMRRTYKATNNIWTGAMVCALLVGWGFVSGAGFAGRLFVPQTWFQNFLGL